MFCCTERKPVQVVWVLGMSSYRIMAFGDVIYTADWEENSAWDQDIGCLRIPLKKIKGCGWEKSGLIEI